MHNSLLTLIKKEDGLVLDVEVIEKIINDNSRDEHFEKMLKDKKHELATVRADIRRYLFNAGILPSVLN